MNLKEARQMLGWTLDRLAQEAGTTTSNIHGIEIGRNRNPGYVLVMRIVSALRRGGLAGLKPEDIFPVPERQETVA